MKTIIQVPFISLHLEFPISCLFLCPNLDYAYFYIFESTYYAVENTLFFGYFCF